MPLEDLDKIEITGGKTQAFTDMEFIIEGVEKPVKLSELLTEICNRLPEKKTEAKTEEKGWGV